MPRLLASASARFGDDDYVISPNGRLSFRQADEQSAQLARQLVAAGVGKGTRVGIVLPSAYRVRGGVSRGGPGRCDRDAVQLDVPTGGAGAGAAHR